MEIYFNTTTRGGIETSIPGWGTAGSSCGHCQLKSRCWELLGACQPLRVFRKAQNRPLGAWCSWHALEVVRDYDQVLISGTKPLSKALFSK